METSCAVEAVSLVMQLPVLVSGVSSLRPNRLTKLLFDCVETSTAACVCLAGLGKKTVQLVEEGEWVWQWVWFK